MVFSCFFFFFKQKTAYEMRISDWSSDVCSSDLGGLERHFQDFSNEVINSPVMRSLIDTDFEVYKNVLPQELHDEIWQCQIHKKIGRASCRERVCQYV